MIETPTFQKQADAIWTTLEREAFIDFIAENPEAGDVIPGADGARKVRWHRAAVRVSSTSTWWETNLCCWSWSTPRPNARMSNPRTSSGDESMKALKKLNVEKVAAAVEADAGQALPGLREALAEARSGQAGRVHTPEQVLARRRGRPVGSVAAVIKEPVKLRLDPDVLAALRATGDGWQTRINEMLRASLSLGGRLG